MAALKFPNLLNAMRKLKPMESFIEEMNNWAQEFPTIVDYQGGIGAMVRLQFAYEFNLTELSENGKIKYVNSDGQLTIINSHERLTTIDYGELAQKATDRQLYHTAIDFVKEGLRLHQTKDEGIRAMQPKQFELLQKFKKDLVKLNNG